MSVIHEFLARVTKVLAVFLERELSRSCQADWWKRRVLTVLTPQQREMVLRRRIASLSGLDLSALLRVLDNSWNDLSGSLMWVPETRHFIKEAQSLRNRWAHQGSELPNAEDLYRDLDTLQRLVTALGDSALAVEIGKGKREVLREEDQPEPSRSVPVTAAGSSAAQESQPEPAGAAEHAACDLILIGCVKTKLPGKHPAKDLFVSPLFIGRRHRAEATGVPWFILSAKYGLLHPETAVDSYDVSLNSAGHGERRRWSAQVIEELKKRIGSFRGKTVEIHAGAAYRDFGVRQGLEGLGAKVLVPLEHARQGEQLAWYSGRATNAIRSDKPQPSTEALAPLADRTQNPGSAAQVEILSTTPIAAFSYRWPNSREDFISGWDLEIRFEGIHYEVRHGIGRRHCFGRMRIHSVTWLDRHPMVEGAEAENYATTRDLISVLKASDSNSDARSSEDIDPAYAALRVVRHCDEITGTNARRGLAVKIREDDLKSWALHALLRSRRPRGKGLKKQSRPPIQAPRSTERPAEPLAKASIVASLLAYGRGLTSQGAGSFTPNAEADAFVREDPFAFLVAVICDEQVRFEAAWEAPLRLRQRLGHWSIERIASEPDVVRTAFSTSPALHRWVTVTADRVVAAAVRVIAEYRADASLMWSDHPSARELSKRLEQFDGIGQKKSAMAVDLLHRMLHVSLNSLDGSDVAVDVHVRRVFLRTGLAERDEVAHIIAVAREANPERPGALDHPAWEIGRRWCRPTIPECTGCPIDPVCPKLVDRASGVRGA